MPPIHCYSKLSHTSRKGRPIRPKPGTCKPCKNFRGAVYCVPPDGFLCSLIKPSPVRSLFSLSKFCSDHRSTTSANSTRHLCTPIIMAHSGNFIKYARLFRDFIHGWALWSNNSSEELRPGAIGYFDNTGTWYRMQDVTSSGVDNAGVQQFTGPLASTQGAFSVAQGDVGAGAPPYVLLLLIMYALPHR
jgi:hypothetical protein